MKMMNSKDACIETDRLTMRQLKSTDQNEIYQLESDSMVHKFVGNSPIANLEQAMDLIQFIRQQYIDHGIGRWAVIEKSTGNLIGWGGLKYIKEEINDHSGFYEVGYRLMPKYWNKGYATEIAQASVEYGIKNLKLNHIYAMAHIDNNDSIKVLIKTGFDRAGVFMYKEEKHYWFRYCKR
jgi:ribosomal-protein-alanine N-acetyltransferase